MYSRPDGALIPTVSGEDLVRPVAERFADSSIVCEVRELTRLDSSSMTFADVDEIVAAVQEALDDPETTGGRRHARYGFDGGDGDCCGYVP